MKNSNLMPFEGKEIRKAIHNGEWYFSVIDIIEVLTNTRNKLTDEWQQRGVKEGKEYSILTSIISKATFDVTPTEHKEIKGLKHQNLCDHMTDLELIFTALGEALTRQAVVKDDSQGFDENKTAAVKGGNIAGKARKITEIESGEKVVSKNNFLKASDKTKELPTDPKNKN
jgi:DNA-damage-inducible protein D